MKSGEGECCTLLDLPMPDNGSSIYQYPTLMKTINEFAWIYYWNIKVVATASLSVFISVLHQEFGQEEYHVRTDVLDWSEKGNNPRRLQDVVEAGSTSISSHPVFRLCAR